MIPWTLVIGVCLANAITSQPVTVGRVIIVGNKTVPDALMQKCINITPGDTVTYKQLRLGATRLAKLGVFEMDPERGMRPTLTFIATDQPGLCDILVRVQEIVAPPK
jgi:outer membrane protein assembly factor BamA